MGTLVEHARRELDRLGADRALAANLVAVVAAYAAFGHSTDSLEMLVRLLRRRPLTPLTADPPEWAQRSGLDGARLWQNTRDSRAMSTDGGRTYTLVDARDQVHRSAPPPGWVRALRERDRMSEQDAVDAVWAYLDAGPINDGDRDELDDGGEQERTRYMLSRWGRAGAPVASLLYDPPTRRPAEALV